MIENHIPELIGSSILALGSAAVWLRKQRVALAKDNVQVAASESNESAHSAVMIVVDLLRDEVSRLNGTNTNLSAQIVNYQNASVQMQSEISILKAQNTNLNNEITALKQQLIKLTKHLQGLKDCNTCPYKKVDMPL